MTPNSEEARLMKALLEEVKRLTLAVTRIERLLKKKAAFDAIDVTTLGDPIVIELEG